MMLCRETMINNRLNRFQIHEISGRNRCIRFPADFADHRRSNRHKKSARSTGENEISEEKKHKKSASLSID